MYSSKDKNNRRFSTKDVAYERVKEKILNCSFEPGLSIVEEKLAKELEVSRTPLREALQRLESEKLVVKSFNGRMKVAPISIKEVNELFTTRSKLEGIVIREAIDNITDEQLEYLSYLTEMVKLTSRLHDQNDINNFGGKFHSVIYEISENTTVTNILLQLNDRISRYRRLVYEYFNESKHSSEEHELILKYIIKKDKDNAQKMIEKHIIDAMNVAIKAVENYKNSISIQE